MKTLIFILIFIAFLQSTILPINLILIILISRAYIKEGKENLYLAFAFGLLTSHLELNRLGLNSLIYLTLVQITQVLSKLRLAGNPLLIVPITFILLSTYHLLNSLIFKTSFSLFPVVLIESLLSLPIFYILRLWEERFIVRRDIKLKI